MTIKTVQDLIHALQEYPPDAPVFISGRGSENAEELVLQTGRTYDYDQNCMVVTTVITEKN